MSQNGSLTNAKHHTNLQPRIIKTRQQSRPARRLRLEGVEPLKWITVTHFQLFFSEALVSQKGIEMVAKM